MLPSGDPKTGASALSTLMADPTDLEKLSQGAFLSEFQKSVAGSPDRIRQSADRAWTVAGAIGGVLIAVGFTDSLREAPGLVQITGIGAVGLWLGAAILFLRVSLPPGAGELDGREENVAREVGEPPASASDIAKETTIYLVKTVAMRDFLAARLRLGIDVAAVALVMTGVALAASVVIEPDRSAEGRLLLTPVGQQFLATTCPALESITTTLDDGSTQVLLSEPPLAEIGDETRVGGEEPIVVAFDEGDCGEAKMRVVLDPELVIGLSD